MKNSIFVNNSLIILFAFLTLFAISCSRRSPELPPGAVRARDARAITIVNNTGSNSSSYQVNVAGSGVEIITGDNPSGNSFSIIIPEAFVNDPVIEVVLVDVYKRIYANTFNVPLEGNTDTPITAGDRRSEGALTDALKDAEAWLNKNK